MRTEDLIVFNCNNTYANLLSAAIGAAATLAAVFLGRAFEVLGLAKQVLELMLEQARK